jgi:hypothetical protein
VKLTNYSGSTELFDHFIEILVHNRNKRVYFLLHKDILEGEKSYKMTKF